MRRAIRSSWENDLIGRSRLSIRAVIRDFNQIHSETMLLKSLAYDSRFGRIGHLELHIAKVWRAICGNQILACQIILITLVSGLGDAFCGTSYLLGLRLASSESEFRRNFGPKFPSQKPSHHSRPPHQSEQIESHPNQLNQAVCADIESDFGSLESAF